MGSGLKDQQILSVWGLCKMFQHSVETLRTMLQEKGEGAELVWDKVTHKHSLMKSYLRNHRVTYTRLYRSI